MSAALSRLGAGLRIRFETLLDAHARATDIERLGADAPLLTVMMFGL